MDLADLLECSICLEQLSGHNKVLPCQHTFCVQCLQVRMVKDKADISFALILNITVPYNFTLHSTKLQV